MSDRNALADELEAHLHGLTHGEDYVPVQLIHKCIAALRATPTAEDAYESEVAAPNREVYGADVEAARNVLKRYRKGMWHINGAIVREALDAATEARSPQQAEVTDAMVDAALKVWYEFNSVSNGTWRVAGAAMRDALEAALTHTAAEASVDGGGRG